MEINVCLDFLHADLSIVKTFYFTSGQPQRKETLQCKYINQKGETVNIECNQGQTCYSLVSVFYSNKVWKVRDSSKGCWDDVSYCSDQCRVEKPRLRWREHQFPRFCCCRGNKCNQKVNIVDSQVKQTKNSKKN